MTTPSYIEPLSGTLYPLDAPRWCSDDRKPLMVTPLRGISRDEIDRSVRSLWRYRAALPVDIAKPISMGEGCTPVVQKEWGDLRPYFKLEWFNPTASAGNGPEAFWSRSDCSRCLLSQSRRTTLRARRRCFRCR